MAKQISCGIELASLATLTGCPADDERFLVIGAAGGLGEFGYATRTWATIKDCVASAKAPKFDLLQLTAEEIGIGETSFEVIAEGEVLQDSVWITLDGPELPRELTDRVSYGVVYDPDDNTKFTINFIQGVVESQLYIIHYAYLSA